MSGHGDMNDPGWSGYDQRLLQTYSRYSTERADLIKLVKRAIHVWNNEVFDELAANSLLDEAVKLIDRIES